MKQVVVVALALTLPMAAWATSIDFANQGGTVSGSATAGLSLSSTLTSVTGLSGGIIARTLGTVKLQTGPLMTGSLATGGTFGAGTITVTGNGSMGIPTGVLLTFTSAMWTSLGTQADGHHVFEISAILNNLPGHMFQGTIDMGMGFTGTGIVTSADDEPEGGNTVASAPEPGTLGLLGTGLLVVAGLVRRRLLTS